MKFAENSRYKVVITRDATVHLVQILRYFRQDLGNEQATRSVRDDILEMKIGFLMWRAALSYAIISR